MDAREMNRLASKFVVVVWASLMVTMAVLSVTLSTVSIDSTAGILTAALCSVLVGAVLTVKVSSNSVGPLALVAGSAWIIYQFGNVYATASLTSGSDLPGQYLSGWIGAWVGAFFPIGVSLLILCFPTGKPMGWWRAVAIAPVVGAVSTLIGAAVIWGVPLAKLVDAERVGEVQGYGLVDAGFILGFVSAVPAAMSVVARYRKAATVERLQIKWLLAATSIFAMGFVVTVATDDANDTLWWLLSLALAAIPIAILVAVLRYRLYEIDRIVSRTISYLLVVGLLAAVFFGVVTAVGSLLQTESDLAIAASTLAVAALFNAVRKRVQGWVDRRFNRSRYDAQKVMDRFAGSLQDRVDSEAVVQGWVGVVSETMQPASVAVWVREG
ncbi:MAG: hypothetical protein ACRDZM_05490 [Acidimicrobiia bacterium]